MFDPSGGTSQADPSWLTIDEAASRLGISRQYIHRLVQQGRIHARMRGDVWLLDPESLRQYEETRRPRRKKEKT